MTISDHDATVFAAAHDFPDQHLLKPFDAF